MWKKENLKSQTPSNDIQLPPFPHLLSPSNSLASGSLDLGDTAMLAQSWVFKVEEMEGKSYVFDSWLSWVVNQEHTYVSYHSKGIQHLSFLQASMETAYLKPTISFSF